MQCPKCHNPMKKITNKEAKILMKNTFFYICRNCNYLSEIFTKDEKPFGENYPAFPDSDSSLEDWRWRKKWEAMPKLKKEHKKIVRQMTKKYGTITDDDIINLKIWIWEFGHKKKRKKKGKKK